MRDLLTYNNSTRTILRAYANRAHIRSRGEEVQAIKHQSVFKARRWVAEGTHSWIIRFRRILIRWETKPENYFGLVHFRSSFMMLAGKPIGHIDSERLIIATHYIKPRPCVKEKPKPLKLPG
jgi:hypothetical protein